MKTLVFSLFALTALAASSFGQAAVRSGDVKIDKITPSLVKTPEFAINGGPIKRSKTGEWLEVEVEFNTVPEMLDELSFAFKILVNQKLVTGTVDYVNIPKGREHYAVAYVAPRTLDALMGGKNFTASNVQGVWVDVTKQGQVIATLGTKPGAVPNLAQVQGLLNKSQTPFAPLYWDRYEALKATK